MGINRRSSNVAHEPGEAVAPPRRTLAIVYLLKSLAKFVKCSTSSLPFLARSDSVPELDPFKRSLITN
jgi:hypothetical protein